MTARGVSALEREDDDDDELGCMKESRRSRWVMGGREVTGDIAAARRGSAVDRGGVMRPVAGFGRQRGQEGRGRGSEGKAAAMAHEGGVRGSEGGVYRAIVYT